MGTREVSPRPQHSAVAAVAVLVLAAVGCVVVPVVPIVLGVFLIIAAVAHGSSPDLRPVVQPALTALVGRGKSGARHVLAAVVGVVFVAAGSTGATLRGQWRSELAQRSERHEFADESVDVLLERADGQLMRGDVEGATFALLGADRIDHVSPAKRKEVDDLLERIRRSGDSDSILAVLTGLPQDEFEAFEEGAFVPPALQFEERALTYRAVEIARARLDDARRARASS